MARERKFSNEELFRLVKKMLLQHGYEGFHFGLLAEQLDISRGALYKYYENKDELITDFMLFEMQLFIGDLAQIENQGDFEAQFDFLMKLIFDKAEVHQLISVVQQMGSSSNDKAKVSKERLEKLPVEMYHYLQSFISLGKKEGKLKEHIPDSVMLGLIFQSIAIPNHFGIPKSVWVESIKEIISKGMFAHS
jgi:TetR/AcrR family transcriptional regulator, repressor of fatR-cypB operon